MNEKVGHMEEKTSEGRSRRMSKQVVDFVQDVVGKKKLIAQFEDGHNKYMSASLL